ncbi:hypothetical protein BaRGS_00008719 [Batillaria attramentaria]|uniref:Uncharacterized protein n=1 Tax=Batillaria attramentaria TaxID=370345 RepID=A0ABD0LME8_9CAEN
MGQTLRTITLNRKSGTVARRRDAIRRTRGVCWRIRSVLNRTVACLTLLPTTQVIDYRSAEVVTARSSSELSPALCQRYFQYVRLFQRL